MEVSKIENLLSKREGVDIDFKEKLDKSSDNKINKEKLLKPISAIANSVERVGWVVFGVEDDEKEFVGSQLLEEEKIQQICSQYISPPLKIQVDNIFYQNKNLGLITIFPLKRPYEVIRSSGGLRKGIYVRRGSVTEEATPFEIYELFKSRDSSEPAYVEWNEERAKQQVGEELEKHHWSDYADNVEETDFKSFFLPYTSGSQSYVITTCSYGGGCHAQASSFGIFEFMIKSGEWVLTNSEMEAFYAGEWGNPPQDYKVIEIGKDRFGIVVVDISSGQGILLHNMSIYTKIGNLYKLVFNETVGFDSSGYGQDINENWSSTISFDKQGHSFYDITLHKKGYFSLSDDDQINHKYMETDTVLKFDGNEYSKTDFIT